MRRSVEGGRDGRQHGQRIDDHRRAGHPDDDRGRTGGDGPQRGHQDEDAFSPATVGQRRQERGQDRRRHHAQQAHQADGRHPTVAVGHDAERHGECPLRRPGPQEAQLGAAQVGVPGVAGERGGGLAEPGPATVARSGLPSHGVGLDFLLVQSRAAALPTDRLAPPRTGVSNDPTARGRTPRLVA